MWGLLPKILDQWHKQAVVRNLIVTIIKVKDSYQSFIYLLKQILDCNTVSEQTLVKRLSSKVIMSGTFATKKSVRALVLQWEARGSRTLSIMACSMELTGTSPCWITPYTAQSSCSCRSLLDLVTHWKTQGVDDVVVKKGYTFTSQRKKPHM